ncbi:hypothetical protein MINS_05970 [Mycolicibacterium insubricum]|jgi:hypothetical protein|uniref:Uncharacterized protein n=1 Tax=Mycolicibacterium insubricum TaxID=444597 RepID=A0A1X0DGU5_9MYCO|nr:hypothetical protein [Mycolicibacterium insubricum]MCB9439454.1 hypothetical protein [Mycolicibacterium sp.]MCV7081849.1 hypothetical protein [Mycolicibacterium insubricum]ORA71605.1 hypothetical protein BST26_07435 [Mycolicibacterium insubricum]BBZ65168.1 hypothetical protein MINS_05970 [Mycolicibacterium insubricum]
MNEERPVALNNMPDLIRALQSKAFSSVDGAGCACMGTHECNGYGPHIEQTLPASERLAELRRQLGEFEGQLGD